MRSYLVIIKIVSSASFSSLSKYVALQKVWNVPRRACFIYKELQYSIVINIFDVSFKTLRSE